MRDIPHFKDSAPVDVEITSEGFVKKRNKKKSLPFSEAQLIEGLNPKLAHADLLATPLNIEFKMESYRHAR